MKQVILVATGLTVGAIFGLAVISSDDEHSSRLNAHQDVPQFQINPSTDRRSNIVCNHFELLTAVNKSKVSLALDTDLPSDTIIMVSVSRSYREKGSSDEYSVDYLSERSSVGNWVASREISITDELWNSRLLAKQKEMAALGLGFDVALISDDITVRMVVPIYQPNRRFGQRNEHLAGTEVRTTGLRIVEEETVLLRPLRTRTEGQSPFANREPAILSTR